MRDENVQAAHAILDFLLTHAAMTGKTKKYKVRIPHKELVPDSMEYDDTDLTITIETDWEQSQDGESDLTDETEIS